MNNINQVVAVDSINYRYRETLKNLRMGGPILQYQRVHSAVTKTDALS